MTSSDQADQVVISAMSPTSKRLMELRLLAQSVLVVALALLSQRAAGRESIL